jgi:DNA-binding NarL/FixJ family response regulator
MPTGNDQTQRPLRVFLVEDSELIRDRLIEEIASARDTEFMGCAETESEAVEKLSKVDCDAVVLDINLARGSGFGVIKSVRAKPDHGPRVIVFTNYAYTYYRELTMEMGADFFLNKATELKRLLEIIHTLPIADKAAPH